MKSLCHHVTNTEHVTNKDDNAIFKNITLPAKSLSKMILLEMHQLLTVCRCWSTKNRYPIYEGSFDNAPQGKMLSHGRIFYRQSSMSI